MRIETELVELMGEQLIRSCYYECTCTSTISSLEGAGKCSHFPEHNRMLFDKINKTNEILSYVHACIVKREAPITNDPVGWWTFMISDKYNYTVEDFTWMWKVFDGDNLFDDARKENICALLSALLNKDIIIHKGNFYELKEL
jgi:hypothetical protein